MENLAKKITINMKSKIKQGSECEAIIDKVKTKYPFLIDSLLDGAEYSVNDFEVELLVLGKAPVNFSGNYFARLIYKPIEKGKFANSVWWDQDFILYNKPPKF